MLAAVCLCHSASGTDCREEDKKEILTNCALSIKNGKFTPPAPKAGVCCQAVRAALAKDNNMMDCIVKNLLTDKEKKVHSPVKMMELVGRCQPSASEQVKFIKYM